MDGKQVIHKTISEAEVVEKARHKVKFGEYVLGPQVSAAIALSRKAKRRNAANNPDLEYLTVNDLDLVNAFLNGVAKEVCPLTTEPCWSICVKGVGIDGFPLIVNAYLANEESEPLNIWSFALCPNEGEE